MNPAALRTVVFLLFFASGAAALIYEVVWSRLLTYLFGATLLAVSTVLAAFMGGLALGSFGLGRVADRLRRPLRLFAWLELGIAAGALAVPWMLQTLEPLAARYLGDPEIPFATRVLIRFAVSFGVLLIPTTLMGATLPTLSRFLVHRRESLGLNIGGLYAANTFGAVTGTALCGFVLIAAFGVRGAQWTAAGLNFLVFLLAMALSARVEGAPAPAHEPAVAEPETTPAARRLHRLTLITYGVAGFVALTYQVVWTRGLVFCTESLKSSTYSFSAMLTVFLTGLALGSAVMTKWVDRQSHPARLYALLLLSLGLAGGCSGILLFNIAPAWSPFAMRFAVPPVIPFWAAALDLFAKAALVMALPTFLMGMAFPVAAKLCVSDLERVGGGVGRLYAINTVGAIFGAFAAGFLLIPALGLSKTVLLLASINIALGLVIAFADPLCGARHRALFAVIGAVAVALFAIRLPARSETFRHVLDAVVVHAFVEGPLATVAVVENEIGHREITIDNVGVAGTNRIMLTDQKSLAHLPMLILREPRAALTVGFGSGGASHSYTLYPELTQMDCVEISETVPNPDIQRLLTRSNHGLLDRLHLLPQYRIIQDDVRSYLRFTDSVYDIIATDCTDLRYKSNANLYDLEYFRLCRTRLTDEGMVVVWMPLGGLTWELFQLALGTFHAVFPEMHVWYFNNDTVHYILLAGFKRAPVIDYGTVVERLARPEINADLGEIDLNDPDKMLGSYVTGGPALSALLEGSRLNTENFPYLEFEAPRASYHPSLAWSNLQTLYGSRTDGRPSALDLVDPATLPSESAERIRRFERAAPIIAHGHAAMMSLNFNEARSRYLEAGEIAPDDPTLEYILSYATSPPTLPH